MGSPERRACDGERETTADQAPTPRRVAETGEALIVEIIGTGRATLCISKSEITSIKPIKTTRPYCCLVPLTRIDENRSKRVYLDPYVA